MAKLGMVIDLEKCAGCQACTSACQMENTRQPGENWQDVLFYVEGKQPNPELKWFPRPCMQCEEPSCMHVCPTKATYKDENGVVLIDWNKCIGCKYCMIACPYGVRFYTDEKAAIEPSVKTVFPGDSNRQWNPPWKMPDANEDPSKGVGVQPPGVVSKCTFCNHRTSKAPAGTVDFDPASPATREFTPACVVTCAPGARTFGDLDAPNSQVNKLIADRGGVRLLDHTGNKPQVYYLSGGSAGSVPATRVAKKA